MKDRPTGKEFYEFFKKNERLSDNELIDLTLVEFKDIDRHLILNLITTTRAACAAVKAW